MPMNEHNPMIKLHFPNLQSAAGAFELLQELGYEPEMLGDGSRPELAIHIERSDVQSALEITHAYGGHLLEEHEMSAGGGASFDAFGEISIPAHLVAEDFTDGYAGGGTDAYMGDGAELYARDVRE